MIADNRHAAIGVSSNYRNCSIPQRIGEPEFIKLMKLYPSFSKEKQNDIKKLFSSDNPIALMDDIVYQENNYGFRANFDYSFEEEQDSIWVFGDSITFGDGIKYEDSWAYKISDYLNLKLYNFSVAGSGIDTSTRLLTSWMQSSKNKPKLILSYGFYPNRFEMQDIKNNRTTYYTFYADQKMTPEVYDEKRKNFIQLLNHYSVPNLNLAFDNKNIWNNFYVDFGIDIHNHNLDYITQNETITFSDIMDIGESIFPHPGKKSNTLIYMKFLDELKKMGLHKDK